MEKKIIYVAKNGKDSFSGEKNSPFLTIERAVEEIKKIKASGSNAPVSVVIDAGDYNIDGITFDETCSGNEEAPIEFVSSGNGEVIINGGVSLKNEDFMPVTGDVRERFKPEARDHVLCYDLKTLGITKEAIGPVYSPDSVCTKYPGDVVGKNFELFWNRKRLTLARYPNEGFLEIAGVIDKGVNKNDEGRYVPGWNEPAPRGGTIMADDETVAEMKTWKEPLTAWANGYYFIDWVNTSSPVEAISIENKSIKFTFSTPYGYRKGGTYFLYNILEELDMPGEYFIDRNNAILYVWPPVDVEKSSVSVSVSRNSLITGNASYITFEGITFANVRNDAIVLNGDHNTLRNCVLVDICGWAVKMDGMNNLIYGCEVANTGEGGIKMSGGDRETLTHSDNTIENCLIHDFAELNRCYNGGADISGCGAIVRHNEFYNCPHLVITHPGNDHLIEYNYLHEVVQESVDAGAIYTGLDGAAHGTVARFNLLENVGNEKYTPCGIYWDDTFSGQTAYGNIFYNVTGKALMIGGGRDHVIKNNVAIKSEYPILFDERLREGFESGGWFGNRTGWYLSTVNQHKVNEEPWASRFPHLKDLTTDGSDLDNINFCANPAYAEIENNVFVPYHEWGIIIAPTVKQFGTVQNNLVYLDVNECTTDGKYTLKEEVKKLLPGFEDISVDKIGRYKD